ncbi:MAG: (2Fe-2S) ferredoxin domain-containing protein, partial [Desulfobacteraceae bacterium]
MARLASIEEFRALRADAVTSISTWSVPRVIIGMGTCGIAAGAKIALDAFAAELEAQNLPNVIVRQTGCMGF